MSGGWVHWVFYDAPASARALPENVARSAQAAGGTQGNNSWNRVGYGGPCPPRGDRAHNYRFTLYAATARLNLAAGATREQVLAALQGKIVGQSLLTGTFQR